MMYVRLNLLLCDDRQLVGKQLYSVHYNDHKTRNGPGSLYIAVQHQLTTSMTRKFCSTYVGALNKMSVLHRQ